MRYRFSFSMILVPFALVSFAEWAGSEEVCHHLIATSSDLRSDLRK